MIGMQIGRHERTSWIDKIHWLVFHRTRWVRAKSYYIAIKSR